MCGSGCLNFEPLARFVLDLYTAPPLATGVASMIRNLAGICVFVK